MNTKSEKAITPDYVMIDPDLQQDTINKQGEIGFVTVINSPADDYWVVFDDGEIGLYAADALLVVKHEHQILDYLIENKEKLPLQDYRKLENIALLNTYGGDTQQKKALKLAAANPAIRDGALAPVALYREPSREPGPER
ncbi:hypothetical protein SNE26_24150 [Mucilaginibacter sp. cycad4]|uniref:hypothetical protein n=1 Tax=Mucilaginibacter sp. cycad4 TaxID=3342096 RepID=UPI002AAB73CD|nr:hypothetical protein [Mucilaginibacter gossypii]WPU99109.1 hypothetical protein SNE26_24150 [Mucilaginibacter gossypii]